MWRNFKGVPNRLLECIQIFRHALELSFQIWKKVFSLCRKIGSPKRLSKAPVSPINTTGCREFTTSFWSQSLTERAKWSAIEKTIADSKIDQQQSQVIGIGCKWFYKQFAKPLTTPTFCEQFLIDDERLPTGSMQSYNFCGLFMSREDWYLVYCPL